MCDKDHFAESVAEYEARGLVTRRQFGVLLAAGAAMMLPEIANAQATSDRDIDIKTPDGTCDAYFVHPASGAAAGVLLWPDIFGLRPAMRTMAKRLAGSGYSVLIVNPFYDNGGIDKGLFWHLFASVKRVALGYAFAAAAGIGLGVLVGSSKWAMRALDPLFQVLRTIPPLAWLPLSLAAFRDGQPSAIFVIFITAIWPIIINTAVGIRNIPQDYRNVARVLRLNGAEFFTTIMLPAAAPYIFTGLRIGIGLSWLAIVAAEMLIGGVGIGFFIWDAWNSSLISDIILALVYVGIIGFLLDRVVAFSGKLIGRGTVSV